MRIPEDASNEQIQQILSDIVSKHKKFPRLDTRPSPSSIQSSPREIQRMIASY